MGLKYEPASEPLHIYVPPPPVESAKPSLVFGHIPPVPHESRTDNRIKPF